MTNLIVTITDYSNYGNRLQNYALQTLLSQYDDTTTAYMDLGVDSALKSAIKKGKRLTLPIRNMFAAKKRSIILQRAQKCNAFSQKYIHDSKFELTQYKGLTAKRNNTYSRVIIGSDQVWNPQWISDQELALRLGSFASSNHPIISYAASFGTSTVRKSAVSVFQKYLPRLKAISVREFQGAELTKEMTGLDATVVLDPTLMINADKWMEVTNSFVQRNDKYVLTYFLGKPSEEQEQNIQEYAKEHDCRVRRILDLRDQETYLAGPQDFVELFSKAEYVFTDSYHACCFSILFRKQFTVFNRSGAQGKQNMNSRMDTLFELFELEANVIDSGISPTINYQRVNQLLTVHRNNSTHWLEAAMQL